MWILDLVLAVQASLSHLQCKLWQVTRQPADGHHELCDSFQRPAWVPWLWNNYHHLHIPRWNSECKQNQNPHQKYTFMMLIIHMFIIMV